MRPWLWLLIGTLVCAVSWTYMHRVLLPWEQTVNVERGRLKAQMGDLYPRWVGTRELLLHGRNPYGLDVSHEIQTAFYGHAIEQTYDKPETEIVDEQRFVYPVYVVFLLAPTLHVDFGELQTWAPIILGALVAITVWLWTSVLKWRSTPVAVAATILLVLSTPQIAQGLRLRQIGFFVAFLLALASWCVIRNQLFLAGVLLAVSTIKPQMVLLCLVWFLLWSVVDWKKRWPLAAGFGVSLGALIGAGELLLPGWPRYFLEGLDAYRKYFPTTSPIRLLLGNWMGGAISVLALIVVLAYAWSKRKVPADSYEFLDVLALFFLASTLILPLLTPYNQILLLLPILRLIRDWRTLPHWGRSAFFALMAWPAVVSSVLLLYRPAIHSPVRTPLLPSVLVLLTPFVVCLLLLIRRTEPSQLAN